MRVRLGQLADPWVGPRDSDSVMICMEGSTDMRIDTADHEAKLTAVHDKLRSPSTARAAYLSRCSSASAAEDEGEQEGEWRTVSERWEEEWRG